MPTGFYRRLISGLFLTSRNVSSTGVSLPNISTIITSVRLSLSTSLTLPVAFAKGPLRISTISPGVNDRSSFIGSSLGRAWGRTRPACAPRTLIAVYRLRKHAREPRAPPGLSSQCIASGSTHASRVRPQALRPLPGCASAPQLLPNHLFHPLHRIRRREAQLLHHHLNRRGGAVAVKPDHAAFLAYISLPAQIHA